MDSRVVGVLGGGQLGRMMVEASHRVGCLYHTFSALTHSLTHSLMNRCKNGYS